ncbi:MAG: LysR family transcriptional regulator, partial [Bacteroidetes bacterium]|nr:LysR family transcriptional regulator [Bacteroidota bacterium]
VMDVTNKARVIESLENNEVDFSLVSVLPAQMQIEKIELMQNKLFLVGNTSRKFGKKIYHKSIFEELPLIYREKGSGTRYVMEKFIERNRLPVKKKMELATNEAVKQAVIAGLGFSIMPLIGIKNELNSGSLQIIPVKGFPVKSVWSLVWLKGKRFSPAAEAYLKYLRHEKHQIIASQFKWYEDY